jgi:hypothetical protein
MTTETGRDFTDAQNESLGKLVRRWARPGNRYRFEVQAEFGSRGETMLCTVTDESGDMGCVSIVHGIESDGYIHT